MRTRFADAAQHADAFFVIRAISNVRIASGVAGTWRFWLSARGGRLQGGGKMRLRSARSKQKKKKVKQENDLQRGSLHTLKNLKFKLLFVWSWIAVLYCCSIHRNVYYVVKLLL